MRSFQAALGAMLIFGLAMAGPARALPFLGKKPAPAAQPAASTTPAASTAKPAPAAPAAAAGDLDIKGFRSAAFGMTPAQVKAAITADFGPAAKIQEGTNSSQGTRFIVVQVDHLDPGPGAAEIGYIFGAASQTLSIVNVGWATGAEPTAEQRNAMADAGQQLAAYFRSGPAPAKTQGPTPVGTNGLVLYIAVDKKNAGVEVAVDGVEYHGKSGDKPVASPPPTGPASLHLAYALNVDKPDVKTLKPGSF